VNEWELLCDADGIEAGDSIIIEADDGHTLVVRFFRYKKPTVILVDDNGAPMRFSAETLESASGYWQITGKFG
jgi:hypothetical protein